MGASPPVRGGIPAPRPNHNDYRYIGKFCAIATHVKFIMNGANHKLDGISTYPFPIFGHGWEVTMEQLMELPGRGDIING